MRYEFHAVKRYAYHFLYRRQFVQLWTVGLQGLLDGTCHYPFAPFAFERPAFAAAAFDGDDTVDARFCRLFQKPFVAVGILGRRDGHRHSVTAFAVFGERLRDAYPAVFRVGLQNGGPVEIAAPVGQVEFVARPQAQHLHAVCRLLFGQCIFGQGDVGRVK